MMMSTRTVAQVAAGVLAGAVLAGVPTWAVASQDGTTPGPQGDMSQMMSGSQSTDQMMTSMSKMMKDPAMRKGMVSMMAKATGQMPGMGADSGMMSGAGGMRGMDSSTGSSGAPRP